MVKTKSIRTYECYIPVAKGMELTVTVRVTFEPGAIIKEGIQEMKKMVAEELTKSNTKGVIYTADQIKVREIK